MSAPISLVAMLNPKGYPEALCYYAIFGKPREEILHF